MGQDGMGQDILPEIPQIYYIGHRRLHQRHCIQPPMQDLNPNVHSVLSIAGEMGQDEMGQDILPEMPQEIALEILYSASHAGSQPKYPFSLVHGSGDG